MLPSPIVLRNYWTPLTHHSTELNRIVLDSGFCCLAITHVKPNYGAKAQYTKSRDTSPALPKEGKKFIQEVIGTFLYYARCIDSTMLVALDP